MTLTPTNPMNRALRLMLIGCNVVCFGLLIPGAVVVHQQPVLVVVAACGAAMVLALAAATLMPRPVGFWLGWATQVAGLALGLLSVWMLALSAMFLLVWITMIVLGRRIEAAQAGAAR